MDRLYINRLNPVDKNKNLCIWMTAGVISYKLCPFNFDCEHCEFDSIMRWQNNPDNEQTTQPD